MSELFDRYVKGKKPAEITHNVVTDIRRGRIHGDNLKALISELDKQGILDNTTVKTEPKSEWNDEYLDILSYEAVGGTFSKQYLTHLAEVTDYVQAITTSRKHKKPGISKIVLSIVIIGVIAFAIILIISSMRG